MRRDPAGLAHAHDIEVVVGDAAEGYNPTHDLCRAIFEEAVRQASAVRQIETFAIDLTGPPGPPADGGAALEVVLDADALAAKLRVGQSYAESVGGTLLREIEQILATHGSKPFGLESQRAHYPWAPDADESSSDQPPFYELCGKQRVASGDYQQVIRLSVHVAPVLRALRAMSPSGATARAPVAQAV